MDLEEFCGFVFFGLQFVAAVVLIIILAPIAVPLLVVGMPVVAAFRLIKRFRKSK